MSTLHASLAIGTALWMAALPAQAVGFGRVSNATQLGQQLNFAAAVRLDLEETLPRECVSAEVQSGENRLQPQQVRVTLEGAPDSLDRSVRITTSTLIDEPVVTVSVTLGCTAKVTRRFVAFIDPPLIGAAQTLPAETLVPQRVDSQVASIVTMVQGVNGAAPGVRRAQRTAAERTRPRATASVGVADAPVGEPGARAILRAASGAPRVAGGVRAATAGPRLQLEPAAPIVARSASQPGATPIVVAASAPVGSASSVAGDQGSQRIQALEQGLAKLRGETQASQASLAALQVRLTAAESQRYANPLVYALAWVSALLTLAVAALWWRQSRLRRSSQWWSGPAQAPQASAAPLVALPVESEVSAPQPLGPPQTAADAFAVSTMIDEDLLAKMAHSPSSSAVGAGTPMFAPVTNEPPRELSVEELIDLEQQAEFFVVLGQDEAAIELLMSHVRSDGGISPMPYLKLLEIYRRRGDNDAYERIRERFNRRFNAYAPDWDADLQQGRSLLDYPDTIERLQQLWSAPARVMETLDASLFRRNKVDETFDLPAYRELLFLYAIARDLAEHAGLLPNSTVDLLLPLDDPGEEPISRLTATTQSGDFQHSDLMTMPLDLDVSFGPGTTQEVDTAPAALRRTGGSQYASADSAFLDFDLDTPAEAATQLRSRSNR